MSSARTAALTAGYKAFAEGGLAALPQEVDGRVAERDEATRAADRAVGPGSGEAREDRENEGCGERAHGGSGAGEGPLPK